MAQMTNTTTLVTVRLTPRVDAASGESRTMCSRRPIGPLPQRRRPRWRSSPNTTTHELVERGAPGEGEAEELRAWHRDAGQAAAHVAAVEDDVVHHQGEGQAWPGPGRGPTAGARPSPTMIPSGTARSMPDERGEEEVLPVRSPARWPAVKAPDADEGELGQRDLPGPSRQHHQGQRDQRVDEPLGDEVQLGPGDGQRHQERQPRTPPRPAARFRSSRTPTAQRPPDPTRRRRRSERGQPLGHRSGARRLQAAAEDHQQANRAR